MNQHDEHRLRQAAADLPVLIAGGGIGGLTTAIALARAGIASHVLERRDEFSEAGAGIQIGPNGSRLLQHLGIADALAPFAGVPDGINVFDGRSGKLLSRLPLGDWIAHRHGAPYWVLHRRDLQKALVSVARGLPEIKISMGFAFSDLRDADATADAAVGTTADTTADAAIEALGKDGSRVQGRALIGADGVWSQVRRGIFKAPALRPSGQLAARAVIKAVDLPPPFCANTLGIWLMQDAHVVHYPVCGGRDVAVVLILARGNEALMRQTAPASERWDSPTDADQLLSQIATPAAKLLDFLRRIPAWRSWTLFDPPALSHWHEGRVALLGDAAHPVLPFLAQGAVMALEDAVVIAGAISDEPDDLAKAFSAYERQRRPRAARVQAASRHNGHIYHLAPPVTWARDATMRLAPGKLLMQRYDWLYGWQIAQDPNPDINFARTPAAAPQSP